VEDRVSLARIFETTKPYHRSSLLVTSGLQITDALAFDLRLLEE
jgi:hypothetical protein